jgi:putative transposase
LTDWFIEHILSACQTEAIKLTVPANGIPEKITMDKSGANKSAIDQIIEDKNIAVEVRQVKYLNNIVEQDHRAVKRKTRPMLGFKSFHAAANVLAGIELMHMIRKGQMAMAGCEGLSFAKQFFALAGQVRPA